MGEEIRELGQIWRKEKSETGKTRERLFCIGRERVERERESN